jgi:hypothetical protein
MNIKYLSLLAVCLLPVQLAVAADSTPAMNGTSFSGKVLAATNAAGYTYVQVDTGSNKLWAVTTQFPVNVGDGVTVSGGMPMTGYHSKSLNRDFDVVFFASGIAVAGGQPGVMPSLPAGHPQVTSLPGAPQDFTGLKRAEGGKTVAEIFAAKTSLAGQPVSVRGKVVKYNVMILGKNWLHIQDGTGSAANADNDLTVTTGATAKVGATVLVSGNVSTNRDFGAGYKYSVILEDAKVTVE